MNLLGFSLIIFLISLTAAGVVWFQLPNPASLANPASPTATADPTTSNNVLNPTVTIDETVENESSDIQTNLVGPLRQYYATQPERLVAVEVTSNDDEEYPAKVQLTVANNAGDKRTIPFLYDFSPWKPSMLDNTPPTE